MAAKALKRQKTNSEDAKENVSSNSNSNSNGTGTGKSSESFELVSVQDQWSEFLPEQIPLRYSFFRYLGFCVKCHKNGKSTTLKGRQLNGIHVVIKNEEKVIFDDKVRNCFKNAVYYVQDLKFDNAGLHVVRVEVLGPIASLVQPLELRCHVHEFMELKDSADLLLGPYGPLRHHVQQCIQKGKEHELQEQEQVEEHLKQKRFYKLRPIDAKWWFRAYVDHAMDREHRIALLQKKSLLPGNHRAHVRKQTTPNKQEHTHFFERRQRTWKRVRNGEIRIFRTEPLYATHTVTVFSRQAMYRQLSLYSQV